MRKVFAKAALLSAATFLSGITMADQKDIHIIIDDVLVKELSINKSQIRIESVVNKNWPSSALGCLQSGQYYLPVITPGYLVKVSVKDKSYILHTDMKNAVLCTSKSKTSTKNKTGSNDKISAIQLSRLLMLEDSSIDKSQIHLVSVASQALSDIPFNCPDDFEGKPFGYLVIFKYDNKELAFYSDGELSIQCLDYKTSLEK